MLWGMVIVVGLVVLVMVALTLVTVLAVACVEVVTAVTGVETVVDGRRDRPNVVVSAIDGNELLAAVGAPVVMDRRLEAVVVAVAAATDRLERDVVPATEAGILVVEVVVDHPLRLILQEVPIPRETGTATV